MAFQSFQCLFQAKHRPGLPSEDSKIASQRQQATYEDVILGLKLCMQIASEELEATTMPKSLSSYRSSLEKVQDLG